MREVTPTRSNALALADERRLMRQGYEFLDEKRTLLAGEMLRRLATHQELQDVLNRQLGEAMAALAAAVERHGLDGVQVQPVPAPPPQAPQVTRSRFLGIAVTRVTPSEQPVRSVPEAVDPSPEARACRSAFEELLHSAARIGSETSNLYRLAREYRRTERRAKALENVLLPEVEVAIRHVDEQLDTMDREESMRARWSHGAVSP